MADPYICTNCFHSYTRKTYFDSHFSNERAKNGGPNPCFGLVTRKYGRTMEEAKNLNKTPTLYEQKGFKKRPASEENNQTLPKRPSTETSRKELAVGDIEIGDVNINTSSSSSSSATLDNQLKIIENQEIILKNLKALHQKPSHESKTSTSITKVKDEKLEDQEDPHLSKIRLATDIDTILNSPLVFNIFELKPPESEENDFSLCCKCCFVPGQGSQGITVKDHEFKHEKSRGSGQWQPTWFTNMKKNLIRHLTLLTHEKKVAEYAQRQRMQCSTRTEIAKCMRHLSYYATKTGMPFCQFDSFLATVNRCGPDLGNINHSKHYIKKYTLLIDKILKQRTEEWLLKQKEVTITLDIGTCLGFTLLAVLLIKGPDVRLMKLTPTSSKKGSHLAQLCISSLQSENITLEILKEKIVGVVGDGAFMKGNQGFKDTLKDFLHENLQFRWDILHLCNRAHVDARGVTAADMKESAKYKDLENIHYEEESKSTPISQLIDYIQKSAKTLRTGIAYTGLKLSSKSFKRPKIWSATHMCLYEFDMVHRFLNNREFFDTQGNILVLAILYCVVMFAVKVMLKNCQKTTVTSSYIKNVITSTDGAGKQTTQFYLQVARTNLVLAKPCFNTNHVNKKLCNETCLEETEEVSENDEFSDLLSSDGEPTNISKNKFIKNLQDFLQKNKDELSLPSDFSKLFRNTRDLKCTTDLINEQASYINTFISRFWEGISKRTELTDLDHGSTSFSEAPAEGVFSVIENVLGGRESLELDSIEALTRVALEGPGVATMEGYDLSKEALELWGGKGERFTTQHWWPGMKQKSMLEIQEGKRKM